MDKAAAIDFTDLIEKTTSALSTEDLRRFFLSTQQILVQPCIEYGVKRWRTVICWVYYIDMISRIVTSAETVLLTWFKDNDGDWATFVAAVLGYFPQFVVCIWSDKMKPLILTDFFRVLYWIVSTHCFGLKDSMTVCMWKKNHDYACHLTFFHRL